MADAHNDLLLACMHQRERGHRDPFGDFWLPQLRAGGVVFQVLPIFTEDQFVGEGALRRTLEVIELAHGIAERHSADVAIVTEGAEIEAVIADGRIALLLALEGAEPIGSSLALIETFWRVGVRMASLTWNRRTMMADGIAETATGGGLSSLGVDAIAEMERVGMIVDISHLSAPGVAHLASIARSPFVATHSSCRALCDHPRNLTDDQMRLVAQSGGFIGINAFGPFIAEADASVDKFVDHAQYASDVVGADHVAIGADFMRDLMTQMDPILGDQILVDVDDLDLIADLAAPADLAGLGQRLIERLGAEVGHKVASANMIDFFARSLPAPNLLSPSAVPEPGIA